MRLEDISEGVVISGITQSGPVTVERVVSFGPDALQVTYRDSSGSLKETLLFRENEHALVPVEANRWSFTANADELKLASEALRIQLAYLFDPYLAVRSSAIEPLPHQITAVYQEMLPKLPLRYGYGRASSQRDDGARRSQALSRGVSRQFVRAVAGRALRKVRPRVHHS